MAQQECSRVADFYWGSQPGHRMALFCAPHTSAKMAEADKMAEELPGLLAKPQYYDDLLYHALTPRDETAV